jgi:hypothetical protein
MYDMQPYLPPSIVPPHAYAEARLWLLRGIRRHPDLAGAGKILTICPGLEGWRRDQRSLPDTLSPNDVRALRRSGGAQPFFMLHPVKVVRHERLSTIHSARDGSADRVWADEGRGGVGVGRTSASGGRTCMTLCWALWPSTLRCSDHTASVRRGGLGNRRDHHIDGCCNRTPCGQTWLTIWH